MKCQLCKKELTEEEVEGIIQFSYATFYFCSEKHAEEYAMG